jgi:hypothetical protein
LWPRLLETANVQKLLMAGCWSGLKLPPQHHPRERPAPPSQKDASAGPNDATGI